MKVLSAQYPRYGYRRIRVFLHQSGFERSWSRTHRLWRRASLLVPPKTAAQARRLGAPAHPHAVQAQHGLSLRLRLRHHCQRSANQMSDRGGRIHPRVPGHRCGRDHSLQARHRSVVAPGEPARGATVHGLGHRADFVRQAILGSGVNRARCHCHCTQRPRRASAERNRRELQRQVPRRVPVHRMVPLAPQSRCS
ncbi:hypothetical protein D3C86_1160680 [compost metagenome]